MNPAEAAKRHRHQAEECVAPKPIWWATRIPALSIARIADAYDVLAANEEQMASYPATASMLKDAE